MFEIALVATIGPGLTGVVWGIETDTKAVGPETFVLLNGGNDTSCETNGSAIPSVRDGTSSIFDAGVVFVILGVCFLVGGFLFSEFPLLSFMHF